MVLISISPHVIQAGYRFIRAQGKRPKDERWQEEGGSNYTYDDPILLNWISRGKNIGVRCDSTRIILESDTSDFTTELISMLPDTHRVKSGGGIGRHFYFLTDRGLPNIKLTKDRQNVGHIKAVGGMCIGAGSLHPDTWNRYETEKDIPVAFIKADVLLDIVSPYIGEKTTTEIIKREPKIYPDSDKWYRNITLNDVGAYPVNPRVSGSEIYGEHPIHGSTSSPPKHDCVNYWINPNKGVWHCFACESGGGALEFFAMREGLIDCSDCTSPSPLTDKRLLVKVLYRLKQQGYKK